MKFINGICGDSLYYYYIRHWGYRVDINLNKGKMIDTITLMFIGALSG